MFHFKNYVLSIKKNIIDCDFLGLLFVSFKQFLERIICEHRFHKAGNPLPVLGDGALFGYDWSFLYLVVNPKAA